MAIGSDIRTWYEGEWLEGNTLIMGAADHATWLGTLVFDGARTFSGVSPDLDLHCERIIRSAVAMGMTPPMDAAQVLALALEGIAQYPADAELYIRPMMWSKEGDAAMIAPETAPCAFALCIEAMPLPPMGSIALTVSPFRRPRPDTALTEAKAACLYPNNGRMLTEARKRGFNNALSLDDWDNVAETATANVFLVKDGVVRTPVPNGTFLNGITRQRIIKLLSEDGMQVEETSLKVDDFAQADEIFLTGNASKVTAVRQFEDRTMQPGPVAARARALYWAWAGAA